MCKLLLLGMSSSEGILFVIAPSFADVEETDNGTGAFTSPLCAHLGGAVTRDSILPLTNCAAVNYSLERAEKLTRYPRMLNNFPLGVV